MTLRHVDEPEAIMETTHFTGVFGKDEGVWRRRFLDAVP